MAQESNVRVAPQLRDAIEFGTLEQCLRICSDVSFLESQGHTLSTVEERLFVLLIKKIDRLKKASNEGVWYAIYR